MSRFLKRAYAIIIVMLLIATILIGAMYFFAKRSINEQSDEIILSKAKLFDTNVSSWLKEKEHVVNDSKVYMTLNNMDPVETKAYFKIQLINYPDFTGISYASSNNELILGNDFTPPEGFDARTRPWYIGAAESGKIYYSAPFWSSNITTNSYVFTISVPIYSSTSDDKQLSGVVTGLIKIFVLDDLLESLITQSEEVVYVVTGDGEIVSHAGLGEFTTDIERNKHRLLSELQSILASQTVGSVSEEEVIGVTEFAGRSGAVHAYKIPGTNWRIISFVPQLKYSVLQNSLGLVLAIILLSLLITAGLGFYIYRTYFIIPLVNLESEIIDLDLKNKPDLRINLKEYPGFETLVNNINKILDDSRRYITTIQGHEKYLEYVNNHDMLTDLYNRTYFNNELKAMYLAANKPVFAVLIGDINGLKLINDAYGNDTGNELLEKLARCFKEISGEGEIVARRGGDEYGVLIPGDTVASLENRIKAYRKAGNKMEANKPPVTLSFGWHIVTERNESIERIVKSAEDMMNHEKITQSPSMRGSAVYAILSTLHEKNKREEGHSIRVSQMSEAMGNALKLTANEIATLKTAALMHDIGKIGVIEEILNKNDYLSAVERIEIEKHSEIGYRILSTVHDLTEIADYTLSHHERWDGNGYPGKIKGEDIPYFSRIIAIVDAFDAMTEERTYRKALSVDEAIKEIKSCTGTQFDPKLVTVFVKLAKSGKLLPKIK